jgi:hypothetical protein
MSVLTYLDTGITHKLEKDDSLTILDAGAITKNFYPLLRTVKLTGTGPVSNILAETGDKLLKHIMTLARYGCYLSKAEIVSILEDLKQRIEKDIVNLGPIKRDVALQKALDEVGYEFMGSGAYGDNPSLKQLKERTSTHPLNMVLPEILAIASSENHKHKLKNLYRAVTSQDTGAPLAIEEFIKIATLVTPELKLMPENLKTTSSNRFNGRDTVLYMKVRNLTDKVIADGIQLPAKHMTLKMLLSQECLNQATDVIVVTALQTRGQVGTVIDQSRLDTYQKQMGLGKYRLGTGASLKPNVGTAAPQVVISNKDKIQDFDLL